MELRCGQKWLLPTPIFFVFQQEALALAAVPHSPLIWWRYIDDIFLLWTHGEDR